MATVTVTPGYNWVSGEVVTPAKMNLAAAPTASVSAIVDADVAAGAAIALSKLATGALPSAITVSSANTQSLVPAGAVMAFAMNSAPSGWVAANGDPVNRVGTYAALFAAIGTTYGAGNGSTTFNLPDLRGYFVRGTGTNGDGVASGAFATKQADLFKSHTHDFSETGGNSGSGAGELYAAGPFALRTFSRTTVATGGAETRPANIALLYCIKF
jgi:microcystin-dependent protein